MRSPNESDDFPDLSHTSAQRQSDEPLRPELDNYRILEELGQGGQSVVFKAIHIPTDMEVALKILPPGSDQSPKAQFHFRREIELTAKLNHPNIVHIRDSGILQNKYFFAMDYIQGCSLLRYLQTRELTFIKKVELFSKICDAMTHAHQRGVIHRDLKPSNIIVDERNEPHIVDFGLGRAIGMHQSDSQNVTLTGEIKGTVAYMSPEQAEGKSDAIDTRSDVYTLGVIFYELITGQLPYDVSGSALHTLNTIKTVEPLRPRKVLKKIDSELETILLKALSKDPAHRYQSAVELQHDIQCWLNGLPIVAKSLSSIYLLKKIISRHRYASMVLAGMFIMLASYSSIFLFRN